jgi:NAD(P)H dehydrogenase (quinone)
MQDINALVTFSSRTGETEKLALAAALGAVQARANIRLRWLRENVDDQTIDAVPGWRENRDRMTREYIAPREIDFLWADVLVLAMPARDDASSPELKTYLDALKVLDAAGKLRGKVGTAIPSCAVLTGLDLILVPPDPTDDARLHGIKVTETARAQKVTAL